MWNNVGHNPVVCTGAMIGVLALSTHSNISQAAMKIKPRTSYQTSGEHWVQDYIRNADHQMETDSVLGISDQIKLVKFALGLPNTDIAEIYKVSRQSLISYLGKGGECRRINTETLRRSSMLVDISKSLSQIFVRSPGALSKNYAMSGESLFNLLTKDQIDRERVLHFAEELSFEISKHVPKESAVLDDLTLNELTLNT